MNDQPLPPGDDTGDEIADDVAAALLERLGATLRATDPVPEAARLAARSAIAFHRLDARIAELAFDSEDHDHRELAGVRATATASGRLLTFEGDVTIELQVVVDGPRRRVIGQVVPTAPAEVRLVTLDGDMVVTADDLGRFTFAAVPGGHVSLLVTMPDGRVVRTSWTVI